MANNTNSVTNASACTVAANVLETVLRSNPELAEKLGITSEVVAKLANHAQKLRSASASQSGPTKEQQENDKVVAKLAAHLMESGEALSAREVGEFLGVNVHKATGLVTRGVKTGKLVKVYDKTKVFYAAA